MFFINVHRWRIKSYTRMNSSQIIMSSHIIIRYFVSIPRVRYFDHKFKTQNQVVVIRSRSMISKSGINNNLTNSRCEIRVFSLRVRELVQLPSDMRSASADTTYPHRGYYDNAVRKDSGRDVFMRM